MKVIVSHDIDHIGAKEHWRDLIIPKTVLRSSIEFSIGQLSFREYIGRCALAVKTRWENIEDLMKFDREYGVPSTFFIAVAKGRGLGYSLGDARACIRMILERGFDIGVHGIAYDDNDKIKSEFEIFRSSAGLNSVGIRIHYLIINEMTLGLLGDAGYRFDSSLTGCMNPFRVGNLWEFPLHVMDSRVICEGKPWQSANLKKATEKTKRVLDDHFTQGVDYFTILFHDLYFNDRFSVWKEWYVWLIEYLSVNRFCFVNYEQAMEELNERVAA